MFKLKKQKSLISIIMCVFISSIILFSCSNDKQTIQNNQSKESKPDFSITSNEETRPLGQLTEATVTKIVDGDTIYVDKLSTRVRLIGVDCPEIETAAGKEAKAFTENLIPVGTKVWLEKDVSESDTYGRPLRYVWLEKPDSKVTEYDVRNKTLNCCLLYRKQATDKQYPPDTKYADWFHTTVTKFAY